MAYKKTSGAKRRKPAAEPSAFKKWWDKIESLHSSVTNQSRLLAKSVLTQLDGMQGKQFRYVETTEENHCVTLRPELGPHCRSKVEFSTMGTETVITIRIWGVRRAARFICDLLQHRIDL